MNINVSGSIIILKNLKTVYTYLANLENDKYWRTEITSTKMTSQPQIGAIATEHSYLSKRTPHSLLKLICVEFIENKKIVYRTLADSKFFLNSCREVESVSRDKTKVTYTIIFDKSIVKHGLGFSLPTFIITFAAKNDMKKYLVKLKTIIESESINK